MHTAIDSFKLVVIPAGTAATLSLLLIALSIVVPLLALAVPRGWFLERSLQEKSRLAPTGVGTSERNTGHGEHQG